MQIKKSASLAIGACLLILDGPAMARCTSFNLKQYNGSYQVDKIEAAHLECWRDQDFKLLKAKVQASIPGCFIELHSLAGKPEQVRAYASETDCHFTAKEAVQLHAKEIECCDRVEDLRCRIKPKAEMFPPPTDETYISCRSKRALILSVSPLNK